jgi:hypothetical protein
MRRASAAHGRRGSKSAAPIVTRRTKSMYARPIWMRHLRMLWRSAALKSELTPDSFPGRWAAMGAWLPAALSGKNPPTIPRRRPCYQKRLRTPGTATIPIAPICRRVTQITCSIGSLIARWSAPRRTWPAITRVTAPREAAPHSGVSHPPALRSWSGRGRTCATDRRQSPRRPKRLRQARKNTTGMVTMARRLACPFRVELPVRSASLASRWAI